MALAIGGPDLSKDLWQTALVPLERVFSKPIFEMWIKPIRPISLDGNTMVLAVQNKFAREWVEGRLKGQIVQVFEEIFGEKLEFEFTIDPTVAAEPPAEPEPGVAAMADASRFDDRRGSNLNPRYTFDDFVIGNSNRFAHAAAQAVAGSPARAYNPLFLYGGVGLGKTHLMHAIGHRVLQDNPNARISYVACEKFTNEFIMALQNNRVQDFRNKYRLVDVLLIDDIQFLEGKEGIQEEFFHTFNALHESGRQLCISSDRPPKEIQTLEARLRSRFEWGLTTDMQNPDLETRAAILRKKAENEKIPVPDDVTSFIAKVIPSNIRELEGALIRVVAYASLTKTTITVELAAEVLKNSIHQAPLQRVTIQRIKETVAGAHGLTVKEMDNPRRDQRLTGPRQIAMYIAHELTDHSFPSIARAFGKKDHTTAMYAKNKVAQQMQVDEVYRNRVSQLIGMCQAP